MEEGLDDDVVEVPSRRCVVALGLLQGDEEEIGMIGLMPVDAGLEREWRRDGAGVEARFDEDATRESGSRPADNRRDDPCTGR